jgi:RNA polymerase sigma factor for flagellar operon FliA
MTPDDALWHAFDDNVPGARDALILRYTSLVRYVASRMAATLPSSVERGDLISYGLFGLIDAIDKYDAGRGVRFETYAVTRIRGAMLDELRALDWAPRSVRARARWVARTREELAHRLERAPTDAEVAEELGWATEDVAAAERDGNDGYVSSLQSGDDQEDASYYTSRAGEDVTVEDPVLSHEVDLTRRLLAKAMARLPERERVVVTLYFREGLTLSEIGSVLGVTESRVCQVYTNAALLIREDLALSR